MQVTTHAGAIESYRMASECVVRCLEVFAPHVVKSADAAKMLCEATVKKPGVTATEINACADHYITSVQLRDMVLQTLHAWYGANAELYEYL